MMLSVCPWHTAYVGLAKTKEQEKNNKEKKKTQNVHITAHDVH